MSSIKNIKYKDNCLDKTIKQILNIHDPTLLFLKTPFQKKKSMTEWPPSLLVD